MASVYILYSQELDRFYVGSCWDLTERLSQHKEHFFEGSYTAKANDWQLSLAINELEYKQARKIESHIKQMKSRKYIENLTQYDELVEKLVSKYK